MKSISKVFISTNITTNTEIYNFRYVDKVKYTGIYKTHKKC